MEHKPLFSLGEVIACPKAIAAIESAGLTLHELLERHQCNECDSSENDRRLNRTAIKHGGHVRSIFHVGKAEVFVETAGERTVTVVCLTTEY